MLKRLVTEMEVKKALQLVNDKITGVCQRIGKEKRPRLVAVSKTKPKEMIFEAYETGQRHFGENYIQELVDKGSDTELLAKCKDIQWHFIGHIQRNKVSKLVSVPNLYLVETVDTDKLANALNTAWGKLNKDQGLRIMVQVNTSGEGEKNGCSPESVTALVKHVVDNCKNLKFAGLMTIGKFGYDLSQGPNPDFKCLKSCKDEVSKALGLDAEEIELSMGMSDDFEHAIEMGSTNVRVGSTIFGSRAPKVTKETVEALSENVKGISVQV